MPETKLPEWLAEIEGGITTFKSDGSVPGVEAGATVEKQWPGEPEAVLTIKRRLGLTPGEFWRAVKGKSFVSQAGDYVQGSLFEGE